MVQSRRLPLMFQQSPSEVLKLDAAQGTLSVAVDLLNALAQAYFEEVSSTAHSSSRSQAVRALEGDGDVIYTAFSHY